MIHSGNFSGAETSATKAAGAPRDAASLIAASQKARSAKTWILTDGSVGMEAQGMAVAEAVGLPFNLKRVHVVGSMRFVPAWLQIHLPPELLLRSVSSNEPLQSPWPRFNHLDWPA